MTEGKDLGKLYDRVGETEQTLVAHDTKLANIEAAIGSLAHGQDEIKRLLSAGSQTNWGVLTAFSSLFVVIFAGIFGYPLYDLKSDIDSGFANLSKSILEERQTRQEAVKAQEAMFLRQVEESKRDQDRLDTNFREGLNHAIDSVQNDQNQLIRRMERLEDK